MKSKKVGMLLHVNNSKNKNSRKMPPICNPFLVNSKTERCRMVTNTIGGTQVMRLIDNCVITVTSQKHSMWLFGFLPLSSDMQVGSLNDLKLPMGVDFGVHWLAINIR